MSQVLIDSSVWISYFREGDSGGYQELERLIDHNLICINDLILSELVPVLFLKKQSELIDLLKSITRIPLKIDWDEIIEFQKINLKKGVNNVGIPDLIILQNVIQNNLSLYTADKHFRIMSGYHKFSLF